MQYRRFVEPNEEQKQLTEKWILSNIEAFLEAVLLLRDQLDERLMRDPKIMKQIRDREHVYPYGLCLELRDEMLDQMKIAAENPVHPGMKCFASFILEGGLVRPFWGIDKGLYFENAIQIGSSILDVANDTVDMDKQKIAFYPSLEESTIKPVETFEEFARVGELYWKQEMYPNTILPSLAPIFPLLFIEKRKVFGGRYARILRLQTNATDLHYLNFYTVSGGRRCGLSHQLLFNSEFRHRQLPEELKRNIQLNQKLTSRADDQTILERSFDRFLVGNDQKTLLRQARLADEIQKTGMAIKGSALAVAFS